MQVSIAADRSEDLEVYLESLPVNRDDLSNTEDPFASVSDDNSRDIETNPFDHLSDNDDMTEDHSA